MADQRDNSPLVDGDDQASGGTNKLAGPLPVLLVIGIVVVVIVAIWLAVGARMVSG
jgi:hypothetical protein